MGAQMSGNRINDRRKLIAFGGVVLAMPLALLAQPQTRVWRLGFLALRRVTSLSADTVYGGLVTGLRDLGYIEGSNLIVVLRAADGRVESLPLLAAQLVQAKVDVIVTSGSQATAAAQQATRSVPVVMGTVSDPVGSGFVKTLARPGGNITGLSNLGSEISGKHFELLREMVPKMSRVAVLVNSSNSSKQQAIKGIDAACRRVNVKMLPFEAESPQGIDVAFELMARQKCEALIVSLDAFFSQQRRQFAELTLKNRLPSIFAMREHVEAGALMSYGQNVSDNFRRAATYVDKIFKGNKPGDLPIEQPTTFELFINGNTAKTLGLTIPQSLRISADKVID